MLFRSNQGKHKVAATGLYSAIQGMYAIESGADFVILYVNRMQAQNITFEQEITALRQFIDDNSLNTKILTASFKTSSQVLNSITNGAHYCTVSPELLLDTPSSIIIQQDTLKFSQDWNSLQKDM